MRFYYLDLSVIRQVDVWVMAVALGGGTNEVDEFQSQLEVLRLKAARQMSRRVESPQRVGL